VAAYRILQNSAFKQKRYGLNNLTFGIDHYAKLGDKAIANQVFSTWYNGHRYYTYKEEPQYLSSGKLSIPHRMLITVFLELVANCHIKYKNKLTIYICELF